MVRGLRQRSTTEARARTICDVTPEAKEAVEWIIAKKDLQDSIKEEAMAIEGRARARLSLGEIRYLHQLTSVLFRFENAYNGICFFLDKTELRSGEPIFHSLDQYRYWYSEPSGGFRTILPEHIAADDWIELRVLSIQSPGFAELVGRLTPLEVLRQWVQDRHERRKDQEYKEHYEKEKLDLENELLRIKVIREKINVMKEAGVPKRELDRFVKDTLLRPMSRLNPHLDSAEIKDLVLADPAGDGKLE